MPLMLRWRKQSSINFRISWCCRRFWRREYSLASGRVGALWSLGLSRREDTRYYVSYFCTRQDPWKSVAHHLILDVYKKILGSTGEHRQIRHHNPHWRSAKSRANSGHLGVTWGRLWPKPRVSQLTISGHSRPKNSLDGLIGCHIAIINYRSHPSWNRSVLTKELKLGISANNSIEIVSDRTRIGVATSHPVFWMTWTGWHVRPTA